LKPDPNNIRHTLTVAEGFEVGSSVGAALGALDGFSVVGLRFLQGQFCNVGACKFSFKLTENDGFIVGFTVGFCEGFNVGCDVQESECMCIPITLLSNSLIASAWESA